MIRFAAIIALRRTCRILAGAALALWMAVPAESAGPLSQNTLVQIGYAGGMCALTFDDGPGKYTPKLLRMLRERGIRATFFLVGERIRAYPELTRLIASEGHEVGNHSMTHIRLRGKAAAIQQQEIASVQKSLQALGVESRLLRPPYGSFDAATLHEAEKEGLTIALWTVDSLDWRYTPSMAGMVSPHGHDKPTRGIFLMHDIHKTTIDALPPIIDFLQASGCRFVTFSEYLGDVPPKFEPPASFQNGRPSKEVRAPAINPHD